MPAQKTSRARGAVNPADTFEVDLLQFVEAALSVVPRFGLGAIELRVRDHELVTAVVLAPAQAKAAGMLLLAVAKAVEDAEGRS
jgi:hypothetical protein